MLTRQYCSCCAAAAVLQCEMHVRADVRKCHKAVTWRPKLGLALGFKVFIHNDDANDQVLHVQRENDIVAGPKASPPKTVTFTGTPGPGASKGV